MDPEKLQIRALATLSNKVLFPAWLGPTLAGVLAAYAFRGSETTALILWIGTVAWFVGFNAISGIGSRSIFR